MVSFPSTRKKEDATDQHVPDALYIQSLDMLDQSIRSIANRFECVCIHYNIPIGTGFETGIILNSILFNRKRRITKSLLMFRRCFFNQIDLITIISVLIFDYKNNARKLVSSRLLLLYALKKKKRKRKKFGDMDRFQIFVR